MLVAKWTVATGRCPEQKQPEAYSVCLRCHSTAAKFRRQGDNDRPIGITWFSALALLTDSLSRKNYGALSKTGPSLPAQTSGEVEPVR